jgi:hypothetical protein
MRLISSTQLRKLQFQINFGSTKVEDRRGFGILPQGNNLLASGNTHQLTDNDNERFFGTGKLKTLFIKIQNSLILF